MMLGSSCSPCCGTSGDPCCIDNTPPGTYRRVGPGCGWPLLLQCDTNAQTTFYPVGASATGLVDFAGFPVSVSIVATSNVRTRAFRSDTPSFNVDSLVGSINPGIAQRVDTFTECDHAVVEGRIRRGFGTPADSYVDFRIDSRALASVTVSPYGQLSFGVPVTWPEFSASLEFGGATLSASWGPPAAGLIVPRSITFNIGTLEYTERNPSPLATGCLSSTDTANNGHQKIRHAYIDQAAFEGSARILFDIPSLGKSYDYTLTLNSLFFDGCKTCLPPSDACNPLP